MTRQLPRYRRRPRITRARAAFFALRALIARGAVTYTEETTAPGWVWK